MHCWTVGLTVPTLKANLAPEQTGREIDRFIMKTGVCRAIQKIPTIGKWQQRMKNIDKHVSTSGNIKSISIAGLSWWEISRMTNLEIWETAEPLCLWTQDIQMMQRPGRSLKGHKTTSLINVFMFKARQGRLSRLSSAEPGRETSPSSALLCSLSLWTRAN